MCPNDGDKIEISILELSFFEAELMTPTSHLKFRSSELITWRVLGSSVNTG
jgi:hypothetical protein